MYYLVLKVCLESPIKSTLNCLQILSRYLNILRYITAHLGLPKEEFYSVITQS